MKTKKFIQSRVLHRQKKLPCERSIFSCHKIGERTFYKKINGIWGRFRWIKKTSSGSSDTGIIKAGSAEIDSHSIASDGKKFDSAGSGGIDSHLIAGSDNIDSSTVYAGSGGGSTVITGSGGIDSHSNEIGGTGGIDSHSNEIAGIGGICIKPNQCICVENYVGNICQYWNCYGISNELSENVCSKKGTCVDIDDCDCLEGYYSDECENWDCFDIHFNDSRVCSYKNGSCIAPNTCICQNDGYYGEECNDWDCFGMSTHNSSVCSSHGICIKPNQCICVENYVGNICQYWNCYGISNEFSENVCSKKGTCVDIDDCDCLEGYYSDECENWNCFDIHFNDSRVCSYKNGSCVAPNTCNCQNDGYYGEECDDWDCFGMSTHNSSVCSSHGICIKPNQCICVENYMGTICQYWNCYGISNEFSNVCSKKGVCVDIDECECLEGYYSDECENWNCFDIHYNDSSVCSHRNGTCQSPDECICNGFYDGERCESWNCGGIHYNDSSVCSHRNGSCQSPDECICNEGYYSDECEKWNCFDLIYNDKRVCNYQNGSCISPNNCQCIGSIYSGTQCSNFKCNGVIDSDDKVCSKNGKCVSPEVCSCYSAYTGDLCETTEQIKEIVVDLIKGSETPDQPGIYGENGVYSAAIMPGSRYNHISFQNPKNLDEIFIYGGIAFDVNGLKGPMNDFFLFSVTTKQFKWVKGSQNIKQKGVYGIKGVYDEENIISARDGISLEGISEDEVFFIGGKESTIDSEGFKNDGHIYRISTNEFKWISGSNTTNPVQEKGVKEVYSQINTIGRISKLFIKVSGNELFMFGGFYENNGVENFKNDVWIMSIVTNEFKWMKSGYNNNYGVYGIINTYDNDNIAGARISGSQWINEEGEIAIFAGKGFDEIGNFGYLNDLFFYSLNENKFKWCHGSKRVNSPGTYGIKGVAEDKNIPGSRESFSYLSISANQGLIFGGEGYGESSDEHGYLQDFWIFDNTESKFKWMLGDKTHVSSPNIARRAATIGVRSGGTLFRSSHEFFIFGGRSIDTDSKDVVLHNDLWKIDLDYSDPLKKPFPWATLILIVGLSCGCVCICIFSGITCCICARTIKRSWKQIKKRFNANKEKRKIEKEIRRIQVDHVNPNTNGMGNGINNYNTSIKEVAEYPPLSFSIKDTYTQAKNDNKGVVFVPADNNALLIGCVGEDALKKKLKGSEINPRDLVKDKILGKGSFGKVYKCQWIRGGGGIDVAVKILKSDTIPLRKFLEEVLIMKRLNHPAVVKVFGYGIDKKNRYNIVLEYIEGGSLYEVLYTEKFDKLNWSQKFHIIDQMIKSVCYIHSQHSVHRDIKSDNFLLTSDFKTIKLCDFGLSKIKLDSMAPSIKTEGIKKGGARWRAPESRYKTKEFKMNDLYMCDVYSLGMTIYEICCESVPFKDTFDEDEVMFMVRYEKRRPPIDENVPPILTTLIENMWVDNPFSRPLCSQVRDYLKSKKDEFLENYGVTPEMVIKELNQNAVNLKEGCETADSSVIKIVSEQMLANLRKLNKKIPTPRSVTIHLFNIVQTQFFKALNNDSKYYIVKVLERFCELSLLKSVEDDEIIDVEYQEEVINVIKVCEGLQSKDGRYRFELHCIKEILKNFKTNEKHALVILKSFAKFKSIPDLFILLIKEVKKIPSSNWVIALLMYRQLSYRINQKQSNLDKINNLLNDTTSSKPNKNLLFGLFDIFHDIIAFENRKEVKIKAISYFTKFLKDCKKTIKSDKGLKDRLNVIQKNLLKKKVKISF